MDLLTPHQNHPQVTTINSLSLGIKKASSIGWHSNQFSTTCTSTGRLEKNVHCSSMTRLMSWGASLCPYTTGSTKSGSCRSRCWSGILKNQTFPCWTEANGSWTTSPSWGLLLWDGQKSSTGYTQPAWPAITASTDRCQHLSRDHQYSKNRFATHSSFMLCLSMHATPSDTHTKRVL